MATLQDVVNLFRSIVAPTRDELELFAKHLPLFNAGQRALWRILTNRKPQSNWFVVSSQSGTPGNPDYFGLLSTSTREYSLPTNFDSLRLIECLTASYTHLKFFREPLDSSQFKESRESDATSPFGAEVLYDIIGTAQSRIMFAGYPPAALDLRLWYVKRPAAFTARTDTLDEFPPEAPEIIAGWCAKKFTLGNNPKHWQAFEEEWRRDVEEMVFGQDRDNSGPVIVQGFLE